MSAIAEETIERPDLSVLTDSLGFRIHMLDLHLMRALGERCARCDLTPGAASVLMVIGANPGIRHGELADALLIQRPNMTKLMKRFEARGLVRRLASQNDRRRVVLALTAKGEAAVAEVASEFRAHEQDVRGALGELDAQAFDAAIARLRRSASREACGETYDVACDVAAARAPTEA